jgi:hypothetical protein
MEREIRINGRLVGQTQQAAVTRPHGAQLPRATPRGGWRLPQARDAGAAVRAVLERHHPKADWLHQVQDGVELFVQRCLEQFAQTPTPRENAAPIVAGSDYKAYARTAEEIKETMAAEEAAVSAAPQQVPRYREDPREVRIPETEIADPMQPQPPTTVRGRDGWAL